MNRKHQRRSHHAGFSLLELQVAFLLLGIALAGLGPLVVMQLRQLKKIEHRFDDQTTYYLVPTTAAGALLPPTYLWSRKLGVAASIQTGDSSEVPVAPFVVHINFQTPASPAPGVFQGNTYLADDGSAFADRGNGYTYGWNADNTANTRNRNHSLSPDERYDTLTHMQKFGTFWWEITVPNGTYTVHVVSGDPGYTDSDYRTNVEGVLIVNGVPTSANKWIQGTGTVVVTDERMTVSNAAGSINNKINFIDIATADPLKQVSIVSVDKSPISEVVTAHVTVK